MHSTPHLEANLQKQLVLIEESFAQMARMVERMIRESLRTLTEQNRSLCYGIILRDVAVDEMENEIDQLCLELILRFQPVGTHLRFAYSTIRANQDLERIGDYAENVARQALILIKEGRKVQVEGIDRLCDLATEMLRDAVQAFLTHNEELARRTMILEEEADRLRRTIRENLISRHNRNELSLEQLSCLLDICRRYERVTDRANNICEDALYVTTGSFAKHPRTNQVRILLLDDNGLLATMAEAVGKSLGNPRIFFQPACMQPTPLPADLAALLAEQGVAEPTPAVSLADAGPTEDYHLVIALSQSAVKLLPVPPAKAMGLDWAVKSTGWKESWNEILDHMNELAGAAFQS
jgi:phosphate transport system protein